jgi:cellulose 1,4-beta-cellobiosidase
VYSSVPTPAAPTGLTATRNGTGIRLRWTAPTGTPAAASYVIDRQVTGGTWTSVTTVNPTGTGTTYTDNTVVANSSYDYRVSAKSAAGAVGAASTVATVATMPVAPTLTATVQTGPQVTINLGALTGSAAYTTNIQRRVTGTTAWGTATPFTGAAITDTSVVVGTSYDYQVTLTNAAGSVTATVTAAVTVPAVPTRLTAAASGVNVALTWRNSTTNQTSVVVQRANSGTTAFSTIATLVSTATTYNDTTVTPGTAYIYQVYVTNAVGSSPVVQVTFTAPFPAPTALAAPAASITTNSVVLTWTGNSPNATGFYIERSPNGTTWTQVGATNATTFTFTNTGLTTKTNYQYRIRAYYTPTGGTTVYSTYTTTLQVRTK